MKVYFLFAASSGTVVVATPGRLADLLERRDCQLAAGVRSLVSGESCTGGVYVYTWQVYLLSFFSLSLSLSLSFFRRSWY